MKEDLDKIVKEAQDSGAVQSRYIDADGKEFSSSDVIFGFKPKKPYKIRSLADKIYDPNFGMKK